MDERKLNPESLAAVLMREATALRTAAGLLFAQSKDEEAGNMRSYAEQIESLAKQISSNVPSAVLQGTNQSNGKRPGNR